MAEGSRTLDSEDLKKLAAIDDRIIDIFAQDRKPAPHEIVRIDELVAQSGELLYANLIFALTGLRFDEPAARRHWDEILKHKYSLSTVLGRNVGVRVAALDYLQNVAHELKHTRIIGTEQMQETALAAVKDTFTDTYNKPFILDLLANEMALVAKKQQPLAVFFFDIDFFKKFNDINGHLAGDVLLIELVGVTKRTMPPGAALGRYGGEEFLVVMPGMDRQNGLHWSEKIRHAIAEWPFPNREKLPNGQITISGGVAVFPDDETDALELVELADGLLYRSKRFGRNRITTTADVAAQNDLQPPLPGLEERQG
ncbi:MAG TPA: GGDEF domain-containing protein [bacterium]|nr:GGDEF domain-containing protein [bacterium]